MGFDYIGYGIGAYALVLIFLASLIFFWPFYVIAVNFVTSAILWLITTILNFIFGLFGKKNKYKVASIKGGFK